MAEAGIFRPDDRVELIDGEIYDMVPIGSGHAGKTDRLNRAFARAFAEGLVHVGVQRPLRLDALNELQPDLMLLKPRTDDYQRGHPAPADVLLLIEVSDSSLSYDRKTKLPLYAKFGVPEVWIVNLTEGSVEVYREPAADAYAARDRLSAGWLAPVLLPGVAVDVAALFG